AIPGPNPPVNIESFFYPFVEDFARASLGVWMWDSVEERPFLWKGYLCACCADMPGSQKMNGMTGHQGVRGCRFCLL
ncbi:hypothetical protein BT69DRAFT_1191796, partial [Atractiella rhizophila]